MWECFQFLDNTSLRGVGACQLALFFGTRFHKESSREKNHRFCSLLKNQLFSEVENLEKLSVIAF
jgi:hypothetical protein